VILVIWLIILPVIRWFRAIVDWLRDRFSIIPKMTGMEGMDAFNSIRSYIPTRYSLTAPVTDFDPIPLYRDDQPFLIDHFLHYEYNNKSSRKYSLCLGDCGMGKTTFLINLYFQTLKRTKLNCVYCSMSNSDWQSVVSNTPNKHNTVLLLDALDECIDAYTDYESLTRKMTSLCDPFYRVIVTCRTGFFTTAEDEVIPIRRSSAALKFKPLEYSKYYICPFTYTDVSKYLNMEFRHDKTRRSLANQICKEHENLASTPLLLMFIGSLVDTGISIEHDYELYKNILIHWLGRERQEASPGSMINDCQVLARSMYNNWLKTGVAGVDQCEFSGKQNELSKIGYRGHPLLTRSAQGLYKFSHRSIWEYILADLSFHDVDFASEFLPKSLERAYIFCEEMITSSAIDSELSAESPSCDFLVGASYFFKKYGRMEHALDMLKRASEICFDVDKSLLILTEIGWINEILYRDTDAGKAYKSAEEIARKWISIISPKYLAHYLRRQANTLRYADEPDTAISYAHLAIKHLQDNQQWSYELLECYRVLLRCDSGPKGDELNLSALRKVIDKHFQNDEYAEYLFGLAKQYISSEDDKIRLIDERLTLYSRFLDVRSRTSAYIGKGRALYSRLSGFYGEAFSDKENEAIDWYVMAKDCYSEVYSDLNDNLVNYPFWYEVLIRIARGMTNQGFYENALKLYLNCDYFYDRYRKTEIESVAYAYLLRSKSLCYRKIGDIQKALEITDNALRIDGLSAILRSRLFWDRYLEFDVLNDDAQSQDALRMAFTCIEGTPSEGSTYACDLYRVILAWGEDSSFDKAKIASTLVSNLDTLYLENPEILNMLKAVAEYDYREREYQHACAILCRMIAIQSSQEYFDLLQSCLVEYDEIDSVYQVLSYLVQVVPKDKTYLNSLQELTKNPANKIPEACLQYLRTLIASEVDSLTSTNIPQRPVNPVEWERLLLLNTEKGQQILPDTQDENVRRSASRG